MSDDFDFDSGPDTDGDHGRQVSGRTFALFVLVILIIGAGIVWFAGSTVLDLW